MRVCVCTNQKLGRVNPGGADAYWSAGFSTGRQHRCRFCNIQRLATIAANVYKRHIISIIVATSAEKYDKPCWDRTVRTAGPVLSVSLQSILAAYAENRKMSHNGIRNDFLVRRLTPQPNPPSVLPDNFYCEPTRSTARLLAHYQWRILNFVFFFFKGERAKMYQKISSTYILLKKHLIVK